MDCSTSRLASPAPCHCDSASRIGFGSVSPNCAWNASKRPPGNHETTFRVNRRQCGSDLARHRRRLVLKVGFTPVNFRLARDPEAIRPGATNVIRGLGYKSWRTAQEFYPLIYGENHQGGVVLELCAAKIRDLREQLLVQLSSGTGRVRRAECRDPFHSKLFALRVFGFGDAVGE